jgi:glycosyltransferase involved in cell wall biosynthesis
MDNIEETEEVENTNIMEDSVKDPTINLKIEDTITTKSSKGKLKVPVNQGVVGVFIPTRVFGREHMIKDALQSIVDQDYKSVRVCVVCDYGSQDAQDAIKTIVDSFKDVLNITLKFHQENMGNVIAQNTALIELQDCDYFFRLSDDDMLIAPSGLSAMVEASINDNAGFVFGGIRQFGQTTGDWVINEKSYSPLCTLFTKEVLNKLGLYDVAAFGAEDSQYAARGDYLGIKKTFVKQPTLAYRVHAQQLGAIVGRYMTLEVLTDFTSRINKFVYIPLDSKIISTEIPAKVITILGHKANLPERITGLIDRSTKNFISDAGVLFYFYENFPLSDVSIHNIKPVYIAGIYDIVLMCKNLSIAKKTIPEEAAYKRLVHMLFVLKGPHVVDTAIGKVEANRILGAQRY